MDEEKNPAEQRERLRQNELKNSPMNALGDGMRKGNLADLVGGVSWKTTGVLILVIIVVLVLGVVFDWY
ncbi:DUF6366 family protein [Sporosarcina sp. ITBMC105]